MTIAKFHEERKGKVLSAENAKALKNAHAALKQIAGNAGIDLDAPDEEGGPQGDQNAPAEPSGQSALDAAGNRAMMPPRLIGPPAVVRHVTGNREVR